MPGMYKPKKGGIAKATKGKKGSVGGKKMHSKKGSYSGKKY